MQVYSPIVEKIREIKKIAVEMRASDVFLSAGSHPSLRVHGKTVFLEKEPVLTSEFLEQYLNEILSEAEKMIFKKNWEIDFALNSTGISRFRVNAFMQIEGLSLVFRKIPAKVPSFKDLNLPEQLKKITNLKNGLVLVTGPMGSGKSTTLASIIDLINENHAKHIVTIEDPVEFIHKNKKSLIEQRELGLHTRSFHEALKSGLRQGADVILLGELRNLETISLAITAAETGALVLATAHTNGASKTINRLIDVFPAAQQNQVRSQLSEALKAVVWQTLIPSKNKKGRIAAFEVMFHNYAVANLIRDEKTFQLPSILETHQHEGMIPMKKSLEWMIRNNLVTPEEAIEVLPEETEFLNGVVPESFV